MHLKAGKPHSLMKQPIQSPAALPSEKKSQFKQWLSFTNLFTILKQVDAFSNYNRWRLKFDVVWNVFCMAQQDDKPSPGREIYFNESERRAKKELNKNCLLWFIYACTKKFFFLISILYRQSKFTKKLGQKNFKEQNRTIIFRKKHKI